MIKTNEVTLVKSDNFGNVKCDFWKNEKDYYMTRDQIGTALEYSIPSQAISNIHNRNADRLDKYSSHIKVSGVDGRVREHTIYSSKGIYEICRFSRQPKADAFMDWTWEIIDNLRTGELELTRQGVTVSSDIIYTKIKQLLHSEIQDMSEEIKLLNKHVDNRMNEMSNSFMYILKKLEGENIELSKSDIKVDDWKENTILNIKQLIKSFPKEYPTVNITLRKIYTHLRNVYGIVFDQEIREYREKYNTNRKPSGLDLIKEKSELKKLFDNIMLDLINGDVVKSKSVDKTPDEIVKETIKPLIVAFNDTSFGATKTYQRVYDAMKVGWSHRQTRYMNQNNLKNKPFKGVLIRRDPALLKLFVKTVNSML